MLLIILILFYYYLLLFQNKIEMKKSILCSVNLTTITRLQVLQSAQAKNGCSQTTVLQHVLQGWKE